MEKIIRVTGKGKISVKPDMICLDITARGTYPDYEEAIRKSADHTKLLRKTIEKSGLPGQDLKTKDFSVQSEYEGYRDHNDDYKRGLWVTVSTTGRRLPFPTTTSNWGGPSMSWLGAP